MGVVLEDHQPLVVRVGVALGDQQEHRLVVSREEASEVHQPLAALKEVVLGDHQQRVVQAGVA